MEGHRVEKSAGLSKGAKLGIAAASLVVIGAVSGYLGLCSWVSSSQRVLPNVSISGIDVSNMTPDQAQAAVDQAVALYGNSATVTLQYGDWSGTLPCSELEPDSAICAMAAANLTQEDFLSRGAGYLRHLTGASGHVDLMASSLHLAQPAFDRLLAEADAAIGGDVRQASWEIGEKEIAMTKGKTGIALDRDLVLQLTAEAADQALSSSIAQGGAPVDVPVDLLAREDAVKRASPQIPDFNALHQEIYVEAKSAEMDPETYEVTDHVVGVDFDVQAMETAYAAAEEGSTFTIPLTITQPAETRDGLSAKLFQDVLGQATSKLDKNANRTHNVKLAAAACDGKILLPGEVFSYNDTTGSRTVEMGYLPSTVYVGGRTEIGVGGGVCQPSSTIYYAALHTTLEIVERHYHKFAVGYVPDGMDATVYYGSLDFRFKNNTDYPVKITTNCFEQNGSTYLTATIYGTNVTGRYGKPESAVYDWESPTDSYQADESVPRGTLVLDREQNPYTGRKATTYRYIYDADGTLVEKQNMGGSKYAMRPRLYHYNPLDGHPSTWVDGKPAQSETPSDQPTAPPEEQPPAEQPPEEQPPVEQPPAEQPGGDTPEGQQPSGGEQTEPSSPPADEPSTTPGETAGTEQGTAP